MINFSLAFFSIEIIMKYRFLKTFSINLFFTLIIAFCLNGILYSQQINKIYDKPGGSGSGNTNTQVESNDNTMFYILGGAVIVGIVVYAIMKDKEKPAKDTTAAVFNNDFLEKQLTVIDRLIEYQSQIPINVSIGMQKDKIIKDEKRYFLEMSYNF